MDFRLKEANLWRGTRDTFDLQPLVDNNELSFLCLISCWSSRCFYIEEMKKRGISLFYFSAKEGPRERDWTFLDGL